MTKREIYAEFGIEYSAKKTRYLSPIGWIKPMLKNGNSKIGKGCFAFSLPAGKRSLENPCGTCCCDCKGCYAKTGHYTKANVKACYIKHLAIVECFPDFFKRAITAQIIADKITECRIHASGDFQTANSQQYADIWQAIVLYFPRIKFWTYTKCKEHETLLDIAPNGNIVRSVIPGIGVNFGHCDYIISAYRKLKEKGESVYICRCGIDKNQHCHNCTHCATAKYVLFLEHSTEYIAEKDPLYPELIKLIESQGQA